MPKNNQELSTSVSLRYDRKSGRMVVVLSGGDLEEPVQLSPQKDSQGDRALIAAHLRKQLLSLRGEVIQPTPAVPALHLSVEDMGTFVTLLVRARKEIYRLSVDPVQRQLFIHRPIPSWIGKVIEGLDVLTSIRPGESSRPEGGFISARYLQPGLRIRYGPLELEVEKVLVSDLSISMGRIVVAVGNGSGYAHTFSLDPDEQVEVLHQSPEQDSAQLCSLHGTSHHGHRGDVTVTSVSTLTDGRIELHVRVLPQVGSAHERVVIADPRAHELMHSLAEDEMDGLYRLSPLLASYRVVSTAQSVRDWLDVLPLRYPNTYDSVTTTQGDGREIKLADGALVTGLSRLLWVSFDENRVSPRASQEALGADVAGVLQAAVPGLSFASVSSERHPGNKVDPWRTVPAGQVLPWELMLLEHNGQVQPRLASIVSVYEGSPEEAQLDPHQPAVAADQPAIVINSLVADLGEQIKANDEQSWDKVRQLIELALSQVVRHNDSTLDTQDIIKDLHLLPVHHSDRYESVRKLGVGQYAILVPRTWPDGAGVSSWVSDQDRSIVVDLNQQVISYPLNTERMEILTKDLPLLASFKTQRRDMGSSWCG